MAKIRQSYFDTYGDETDSRFRRYLLTKSAMMHEDRHDVAIAQCIGAVDVIA